MELDEFQRMIERAKMAAKAYYDTGEMIMTDAEYDELVGEIERQRVEHPEWGGADLVNKVAGGVSAGGDVQHSSMMMSLEKVKTEGEVLNFLDEVGGNLLIVEPKLDGLAIRAVYENGQLVLVATRGDGYTGENITDRAKWVSGLPEKLQQKVDLEVRGEIYMTDQDFEEANLSRVEHGKAPFVNPRNATAGALRALDREYKAPMSFSAYEVSGGEDSYTRRLERAASLGVSTVSSLIKNWQGEATSKEEVQRLIAEIGKRRSGLGFPIDGAVIKLDSEKARNQWGLGSHAPHWARAYKYAPDTAQTTLLGIEVGVGRTGRVSVRAVLEPVFVGGAKVSYATLHYPTFVEKGDFRVGDKVFVYRSGDVIPRLTAPNVKERSGDLVRWKAPDNCPQCGEGLTKEGLLWRCDTPECSIGGRLRYFAGRDVMDIEGLDEVTAEALVESGLVKGVSDLYHLTKRQLSGLVLGTNEDGKQRLLGEKRAEKVLASIEHSKQQPWARVITSLGIRGVGRTMGRRLAASFSSMDELLSATNEELARVEGVGDIKAKLIGEGLMAMREEAWRLRQAGVQWKTEARLGREGGEKRPLEGLKVVVTGNVPGLTRTQAQEAVEQMGGRASSGVSNATDLVVIGDGAGGKAERARQLGLKIMPANEFAKLYQTQRGAKTLNGNSIAIG